MKPITTTAPYEICEIDVLELGPTTKGNRYAVALIDAFGKWCAAHVVPVKTAESVFVEGRCPIFLISDREREFENTLLQEITAMFGVEVHRGFQSAGKWAHGEDE